MEDPKEYLSLIEAMLRSSGKIAMERFGEVFTYKTKQDPRQVVTEVDLASEKQIIDAIRTSYPTHTIIAEESGFSDKNSPYTWIIDPIDGTSNYSRGLPWFGVMIALLKDSLPLAAGIFLPVTNELYIAGRGTGLLKNGKPVRIPDEALLQRSLVSYCITSSDDQALNAFEARIVERLAAKVLSVRTTNSALDYVYAAEGKLAATINLENKIWDIAPVILLAKEAGCIVTDSDGGELALRVTKETYVKNFSLVIAHPQVHKALIELIAANKAP
ncbi:MAG: inositol monophosphatase [Candidatus Levybacteria bacterium]|nr:inositol monophosphatase [Candidatus Levybacteria bacterium]